MYIGHVERLEMVEYTEADIQRMIRKAEMEAKIPRPIYKVMYAVKRWFKKKW